MNNEKIIELYDKYSFPMLKACITKSQKEKAEGIAKTLWLLLVTGKDSEKNIYAALKSMVNQHDKIISFGALYYHKMKKVLTEEEILLLKKHYEDSSNFNSLKDWGDMNFVKKVH